MPSAMSAASRRSPPRRPATARRFGCAPTISIPKPSKPMRTSRLRASRSRGARPSTEGGAMKLYSGPLSLFSRKAEIALREKRLDFERVMVPFSQSRGYSPKHPDVLAANPKAQVPVLIDGDLTLFDSTLIIEYLEDAYPDPPLHPRPPRDRARGR